MYDNVTHLVASAARRILHREYPSKNDRENAVGNNLSILIRGWEPELRKLFPRVDWDRLALDDVIAEVKADEADEGLRSAM